MLNKDEDNIYILEGNVGNENDNYLIFENSLHFSNNNIPHINVEYNDDSSFYLNNKRKNENKNNVGYSENENKNLDIKRKNKLKRNAESARKSRARKKELMNNLIQENLKLKLEINELKKIINNKVCNNCKKHIFQEAMINDNTNNIKFKNHKLFLFSTFSISIILFIFFNYTSINSTKILRNLNFVNEKSGEPKYINLELQNLTLASMHILFGDYYSLIKRKKNFLYNENNIIYSFKNIGKVRIIKENEITENMEPKNCENCVVELEQNALLIKKNELGNIQFKIIITPNIMNKDEKGRPILFYEIDCYGYGFSKNYVYPKSY